MSHAQIHRSQVDRATFQTSPTSANGFSSLPEVLPRRGEAEKEVAGVEGKEVTQGFAYGLPSSPYDGRGSAPGLEVASHSRAGVVNGKPRKARNWICAGIAILLVLGIALGVGLGVSINSDPPHPAAAPSDHSPGTTSFSTSGAYNGTGIAVFGQGRARNLTSAQPENDSDEENSLLVVFQHHTGELRWMQHLWPDTWRGGSTNEVIASDAKNGTPISVREGPYPIGTMETHVFYVDKDNLLKQRSIDNVTFTWVDGPLSALNIKVLDADKIGLDACFYAGPIDNVDLNGTLPDSGIRLFVATGETTFNQLAWRSGLPSWTWEQSWEDLNGHASPACYDLAGGNVTYVMFVGQQNAIELYWRDTGSETTDPSTHPLNVWTKSTQIDIANVDPSAGLGYHASVYARMAETGVVKGWNISFAAQDSKLVPSVLPTVEGTPGVSGTHLGIWSFPSGAPPSGADVIMLFYQTQGNDITMFSGSVSSGQWHVSTAPIPDK